jgi:hypothetical protein
MQLETGKSRHGLVGTFRNIIREEGCVNQREPKADSWLNEKKSGLDDFTEVKKNCLSYRRILCLKDY